MRNVTHNFFYSRFYIGRFDYLPFFYFGQKKSTNKKIAFFFGNQCKVAIYTGCPKRIYCPTSNAFLAIFKGSSRKKLMPKDMQQQPDKKLVLWYFYGFFLTVAIAFILKRQNIILSLHYFSTFKTDFRMCQ